MRNTNRTFGSSSTIRMRAGLFMVWDSSAAVGCPILARAGRQGEIEGGPRARMAGHADLAAVSGDDLTDDGQAQPHPAAVPRSRYLVELLEEVRQMLGRYPLAGIRDGQANRPVPGPGRQPDLAPAPGMPQGVADQVV